MNNLKSLDGEPDSMRCVFLRANDFIDRCERQLRVHSTLRDLCLSKLKLSLYGHEEKKRRFQLEMEVTTQISILQHLSCDARICDTDG